MSAPAGHGPPVAWIDERPGVYLVHLPDGRVFGIPKVNDDIWRADMGGLDALVSDLGLEEEVEAAATGMRVARPASG